MNNKFSKSLLILLLSLFVFSCSHTAKMLEIPDDLDFSKDYEPVKLNLDAAQDEFRILQLADTQMRYATDSYMQPTLDLIKDLVEKADPHLIVLTGDNTEGPKGVAILKKFLPFLSDFNIPYAAVFGNHDPEAASKDTLAKIYMDNENSLFQKGPRKIHGVGNYVINLMSNEEIKYSIYMIDSNRYRAYSAKDRLESQWKASGSYDYIYPDQIAWYKYNVNRIKDEADKVVNSLAFFHIALPEHRAYEQAKDDDVILAQAGRQEAVCNPWVNTGLFDVMKELGSTKGVFVGHDHINNYVFNYQGIILGYGMKTGKGSYHDKDLLGGTLITLKNNFQDVEVKHILQRNF